VKAVAAKEGDAPEGHGGLTLWSTGTCY